MLVVVLLMCVVLDVYVGSMIVFGVDMMLDYMFMFSYGFGMCICVLSGNLLMLVNINGDDGDCNFVKNKLIENQVSLFGEVNLKYDDWGIFVCVDMFYDQVYWCLNYNDVLGIVNYFGQYNDFMSDVCYWLGGYMMLFVVYVYNMFYFGLMSLNVKVGDQVVVWGESLFFLNIVGVQGLFDVIKLYMVGVEVKDILLLVLQILMQWQIMLNFSLFGYYQFLYQQNWLIVFGMYWSYFDVMGFGV